MTSAAAWENGSIVGEPAIGVDVGGTKIAAAVVDETGRIARHLRAATPASDGAAVRAEIIRLVRELDAPDLPIGVAAAGFINAEQSVVTYAPNIDWRDVPLRDELALALGRPVVVDNDANAAGWAECRVGAGRGVRNMTLLTIGTGVGGAVIADGVLLRGGFGAAGELGHLRVEPDGRECGCGQRGCLETVASGTALVRRLSEIADADADGSALEDARARDGALTVDNVGALIAAGDPAANRAIRELGTALGRACASLSAILDPERFVFGGGLAVAGEFLLAPVREAFAEAQPARGFRPLPSVAAAELGAAAGVVGAADLARIYVQSRTAGK